MSENPLANAFRGLSAPEDMKHYAALGQLVSAYAGAEAGVHVIARKLSKLGDEKARAIFSGMRIVDLADRIKRMVKLDPIDQADEADVLACLDQLNVISDYRNRLVHQLTDYATGHIRATNLLMAKSMQAVEVKVFTLNDLEAMMLDCFCISVRLIGVAFPRVRADAEFERIVRQPWRYKPAPPNNPAKRSRKGAL